MNHETLCAGRIRGLKTNGVHGVGDPPCLNSNIRGEDMCRRVDLTTARPREIAVPCQEQPEGSMAGLLQNTRNPTLQ
jgi:hypothetical protein